MHFDYDDSFELTSREEKQIKKRASQKDRSKYKISDQKKKKKSPTLDKDHLKQGRVISMTSGLFLVQDDEKKIFQCHIRGKIKKEKTKDKNLIAIGDFVFFTPINTQEGQIEAVQERFSFLQRLEPRKKQKQIIAANIDQVFITASVKEPSFKPFLIDRYIIAATKGNMNPIVLLNKVDLLKGDSSLRLTINRWQEVYQILGYDILAVSAASKKGIAPLKKRMKGKTSLFSGQSGVGKSTLINLTTGSSLFVQKVHKQTSKGVHTTTKAHLIPLGGDGFVVDTPGIKHFGLWDLTTEDLKKHFNEITKVGKECKYPNCEHIYEPDCAVKKAVQEEIIFPFRYESYTTLKEEIRKQ
jgi:ribosome biogenesis GTPase / thiamine phosphate phosphatase